MSIRCPNNIEMHVGINAAAVCDRALAKRSGFQCPRSRNRYDRIQASCFNIETLVREGRKSVSLDTAREILFPDRLAISGTGMPTKKPDPTDEIIKTLGEPLP